MESKQSKKYRFRKLYFKCENKQIIAPNVAMTNAYQKRKDAQDTVSTRRTHYEWEYKTVPLPVVEVHGFYQVHESLYDLILKPHDLEGL